LNGFNNLRFREIIAMTGPENTRSYTGESALVYLVVNPNNIYE